MRKDFSGCIKKIRMLEETNDKLLADAVGSLNYTCSKTTELLEQLLDKTKEFKELELNLARYHGKSARKSARMSSLPSRHKYTPDFNLMDFTESTLAANCGTLDPHMCTRPHLTHMHTRLHFHTHTRTHKRTLPLHQSIRAPKPRWWRQLEGAHLRLC